MLRRVVHFAGHVFAVATTAGAALLASAHTANSDLPFHLVRNYGFQLAEQVLSPIDVVARASARLLRGAVSGPPVEPVAQLVATTQPAIPPSIHRVVVGPDGHARLSGVAAPGMRLALLGDGGHLAQTMVDWQGHWHVQLDHALGHGVHRIRSIAIEPKNGNRLPGQQLRIALPQSITEQLVVHGAPEPATTTAAPPHKSVQLAQDSTQRNERDRDDAARDEERDQRADQSFAAPIFNWLQTSSTIYQSLIADDLAGGRAGRRFVFGIGVDDDLNDRDVADSGRRFSADSDDNTWIFEPLRTFRVQLREWFLQAQESYRENIVENLATGERVSRDRFVRNETEHTDPDPDMRVEPAPERDVFSDHFAVEPTPADPDVATTLDWPVVEDVGGQRGQPPRVDVSPLPEADPQNERLIRRAEQDAEKARNTAREAARRAEELQRETERLLAEQKKLDDEAAARRRAAGPQAEQDLERGPALTDEQRAASAARKAAEADRLARAYTAAQRKAAEDLAAAATAEADEAFQSGAVQDPPEKTVADGTTDTSDSDTAPSRGQETTSEFTVADTDQSRRLSLKDTIGDGVVEEGSTMGEIDDFHPSVKYVFDMGPVTTPRAKQKKRVYRSAKKKRAAKRRKAYHRKAKRKRKYHRRAKQRRRAYRRRAYRARGVIHRRSRYRPRARVNRFGRRLARPVRSRFGRLYKFKRGYRRTAKRRRVYANRLYMPRIKWR